MPIRPAGEVRVRTSLPLDSMTQSILLAGLIDTVLCAQQEIVVPWLETSLWVDEQDHGTMLQVTAHTRFLLLPLVSREVQALPSREDWVQAILADMSSGVELECTRLVDWALHPKRQEGCLVVGITGSAKTSLVGSLVAHSRRPRFDVDVLDVFDAQVGKGEVSLDVEWVVIVLVFINLNLCSCVTCTLTYFLSLLSPYLNYYSCISYFLT